MYAHQISYRYMCVEQLMNKISMKIIEPIRYVLHTLAGKV